MNATFSTKYIKRSVLFLGVAVFLASCINVDDFGPAWAKTYLDPDVAGNWKNDMPHKKGEEVVAFAEKDGSYEIPTYKKGKPDKPIFVRNLTVGPYKFFAKKFDGSNAGEITRYAIHDGSLIMYEPTDAVWDFVKSHYPLQKNIYMSDGIVKVLSIKILDDETFKILATIPDEETYWHAFITLEKTQ